MRKDKLINMADLSAFFTRLHPEFSSSIPAGFLDSLLRHYNYTVLQEVKESLYYYNEEQISREIQNYLFAVSFEPGTDGHQPLHRRQKLEITERLLRSDREPPSGQRKSIGDSALPFGSAVQKQYTASDTDPGNNGGREGR